MGANPMRKQIFISYSHQDEAFLGDFKTMLAPLLQKGSIDLWDDKRIEPGDLWREAIEKALSAAKIAVLLVSPDFLASNFITTDELPKLLQAANHNELKVFWVHLSECLYEETPIAAYQAAHDIVTPIDSLTKPEQRKAWADIARKLGKLANP